MSDGKLTDEERDRLVRLEAMIDDVAAIAHKLNNPLTTLLGRAQLIRRNQDDDRLLRLADEVEHNCQRLAGDVRTLARTVNALRRPTGDRS